MANRRIQINPTNLKEARELIGHESTHLMNSELAAEGDAIAIRICNCRLANEYFAYRNEFLLGGRSPLNMAASRGPQEFTGAYYISWYGARDISNFPKLPRDINGLYPQSEGIVSNKLLLLERFDR
jgi:hypothetical protein